MRKVKYLEINIINIFVTNGWRVTKHERKGGITHSQVQKYYFVKWYLCGNMQIDEWNRKKKEKKINEQSNYSINDPEKVGFDGGDNRAGRGCRGPYS